MSPAAVRRRVRQGLRYATTYGTTIATGRVNFAPSQKNTLVINSASNASGWAATISNPGYNAGSCGIFVGSTFSGSGTPAVATQEGVPVCPDLGFGAPEPGDRAQATRPPAPGRPGLDRWGLRGWPPAVSQLAFGGDATLVEEGRSYEASDRRKRFARRSPIMLEDTAFGLRVRWQPCTRASRKWKNLFLFEVFGRLGTVTVHGLGGSYGTKTLSVHHSRLNRGALETETRSFEGPEESWRLEWEDFVRALDRGTSMLGTADEGVMAMRMRFPNLCVVGGGGYVGTVLTRALLEVGHRVTVFDAFWFGDHLGHHACLTKIRGDLRDTAQVRSAMTGSQAVALLACISNDPMADIDPAFTKEVNLDAIQRLILAAKEVGVQRLVYASSTSVYGIQDIERVVEETPHRPITLYSRYKSHIEQFLRQQLNGHFTGVIVRGATVSGYSPRMRLDLLVNLFSYLGLVKRVIAIEGGKQIRPLIHIQDLVEFYRLMLETDSTLVQGEAFNVSSGNFTVVEVAEMVQAYTGCELTYSKVVDSRSYPADAEKAARVLGYRTRRTIHDAMVEVCDAIRDGRIRTEDTSNFNLRRYKELLAVR